MIDHVAPEGAETKGLAGRAYGSRYKKFLARLQWEAVQKQRIGEDMFEIGLYHTKGNHTALLKPLGFVIDFRTAGAVQIRAEDPAETREFLARLPPVERLRVVLRDGALSGHELAERLDVAETTVRAWVARYSDVVVRLADKRLGLRGSVQSHFLEEALEDIPF